MHELIVEDGQPRQHRSQLADLLKRSRGPVRIASAYVTDRSLLTGIKSRKVSLLTSASLMDIASGATSIETLRTLIESGVQCRCLSGDDRLHAKVYIFGSDSAVVSSANLTNSAFNSNIEVGVRIEGDSVTRLVDWFDRLWSVARPLNTSELAERKQAAKSLRREYARLRKRAATRPTTQGGGTSEPESRDDVTNLLNNAPRVFVCNSNRKYSKRTSTRGYDLEQAMYTRGLASVWERFKHPRHMKQVGVGDAILMFAKGVGIIGVGRAKAGCEVLEPGDPNRIQYRPGGSRPPEWRVPVDWLDWREDTEAFPWKSSNCSFLNVTDPEYDDLREGVRKHFRSLT